MFETSSENGKKKIIRNSIFWCENEENSTREEVSIPSSINSRRISHYYDLLTCKNDKFEVRSVRKSYLYETKTSTSSTSSSRKIEVKSFKTRIKTRSKPPSNENTNEIDIVIVMVCNSTQNGVRLFGKIRAPRPAFLEFLDVRSSILHEVSLSVSSVSSSMSSITSSSLPQSLLSQSLFCYKSPLSSLSSLQPSFRYESPLLLRSFQFQFWLPRSSRSSGSSTSQPRAMDYHMKTTKNVKIIIIIMTKLINNRMIINIYIHIYIHIHTHIHIYPRTLTYNRISVCVSTIVDNLFTCLCLSHLLIITSDACLYLNRLPFGSSSHSFQKLESKQCLDTHVDSFESQKMNSLIYNHLFENYQKPIIKKDLVNQIKLLKNGLKNFIVRILTV